MKRRKRTRGANVQAVRPPQCTGIIAEKGKNDPIIRRCKRPQIPNSEEGPYCKSCRDRRIHIERLRAILPLNWEVRLNAAEPWTPPPALPPQPRRLVPTSEPRSPEPRTPAPRSGPRSSTPPRSSTAPRTSTPPATTTEGGPRRLGAAPLAEPEHGKLAAPGASFRAEHAFSEGMSTDYRTMVERARAKLNLTTRYRTAEENKATRDQVKKTKK